MRTRNKDNSYAFKRAHTGDGPNEKLVTEITCDFTTASHRRNHVLDGTAGRRE